MRKGKQFVPTSRKQGLKTVRLQLGRLAERAAEYRSSLGNLQLIAAYRAAQGKNVEDVRDELIGEVYLLSHYDPTVVS